MPVYIVAGACIYSWGAILYVIPISKGWLWFAGSLWNGNWLAAPLGVPPALFTMFLVFIHNEGGDDFLPKKTVVITLCASTVTYIAAYYIYAAGILRGI